jgi:ABC-type uncharacterized transport system substrate-binding protein
MAFAHRRRYLGKALCTAALALFASTAAHAHPHAWIDVNVEVVFDREGRVAGLKETWLFDDFYTEYAMQGRGRPGAMPDQELLTAVMHENMTNLADYTYFTRAEVKKAAIAFGPPTDMSSRLRDRRIEMTFMLPFATPIRVDGEPLTYMIFDPSYYIEMLHVETPDAVRLTGAPAGCSQRIVQPHPSLDQVARAAALDRNQSGGDKLGIIFAQRVTVQCGSRK